MRETCKGAAAGAKRADLVYAALQMEIPISVGDNIMLLQRGRGLVINFTKHVSISSISRNLPLRKLSLFALTFEPSAKAWKFLEDIGLSRNLPPHSWPM